MMTCDTMMRLVHEMYEVADKISEADMLCIAMKRGTCPCPTVPRSC